MSSSEMESTIRSLLASGKVMLAVDECMGTNEGPFQGISLESTEERRRQYRQLLFTTPKLGEYLSGVISLSGRDHSPAGL